MVENGACGELGGVHLKFEGLIVIRLSENRVGGGKVDKTVKSRGAFRGPDEGGSFLKEIQERASDIREPGDKGAMISEDSQCGSYFLNGFQYTGPFGDARDFARVDAKGFAIKQES